MSIGDRQSDDLDAFLRQHDGLDGLARELGQHDPNAYRFEPPANENAAPRGRFRTIRKGAALAGGIWLVSYPVACFALLSDWHHPWIGKHPIWGAIAVVGFVGPLALAGFLFRRA